MSRALLAIWPQVWWLFDLSRGGFVQCCAAHPLLTGPKTALVQIAKTT
jgi:hypothetical protein